ncbi:hypothetical protein ACFX13_001221 [Malus domestica]
MNLALQRTRASCKVLQLLVVCRWVLSEVPSWKRPAVGYVKINCDGSWCSQTGFGGYGWVVRSSAGIFKVAGGFLCSSSATAEAYTIRAGLTACLERGFRKAELESDAKRDIRYGDDREDYGRDHPRHSYPSFSVRVSCVEIFRSIFCGCLCC